ncbi:single-stranded DNA-binding protein [Sulfurimonas autotrophica]|uniref:Single-stranded DNA-binding protein n=1 Tax=Sulfurimonas autotrophica (strain ATCC BAA-671 / DSM 16294 / JCM 11897 / OK10) TaxID=563040 RepID=E0UPU6_SULAO|nr:single-stranded DNA-binding protein [Sulfurimonas autotrophica]ADN09755.1 single-strand binding protein [Sulfurimonas autotrophica DSM 16294]
MFNKIILVGNLTRDIELRYSQGGMGIAKTAIATSRKFTSNGEKKEEVCFVDITFFGRSAEVANQYLRKGSKILVEGRLNFEQWVDQNGQKRSKHSVIVETMQMLDSKGDNQGSGYNAPAQNGGYNAPAQGEPQGYQQPAQQQQQSYQPQQQQNSYNNNQAASQSREMPSSNSIPEIDIDEDEIPF